jgi:hypothetical protein
MRTRDHFSNTFFFNNKKWNIINTKQATLPAQGVPKEFYVISSKLFINRRILATKILTHIFQHTLFNGLKLT